MMVRLLLLLVSGSALHRAAAQCTAVLEKWAKLPAETYAAPPSDASEAFRISGKYTSGNWRRQEGLGVYPSCSIVNSGGCTDVKLPVQGQPIQGLSGARTMRDSRGHPTNQFLMITDNGFGTKKNSPDAMLFFHILEADFSKNLLEPKSDVFLSDPNKRVPFLIVDESSKQRYLTGSDFKPESIQPVGDEFWIGDEFGPFLINTDKNGKVIAVYDTPLPDGQPGIVKSPDQDSLTLPDPDKPMPIYHTRRSRGFEGMALDPRGRYLYPLLEGPLYNTTNKTYETRNGIEYLRIYKFDLAAKTFLNNTVKYPLEQNGNSIGDFNMIDDCKGMIIERDAEEGSSDKACSANQTEMCWASPAKFKRIYLVDICKPDSAGFIPKDKYIDLLNIKDPDGLSPYSNDGTYTFPYYNVENVDVYDERTHTIIVANDNNFPYSNGRIWGKPDESELIVLEVPAFFNGDSCGGIPSSG